LKRVRLFDTELLPAYLVFISLLLFSGRSIGEASTNPITLANFHKVAAIGLLLFLLAIYFLRKGLPRNWPKGLVFFGCFIVVSVISTFLYSPWVLFSLWKSMEILAVFGVALFVLHKSRSDGSIIERYYEAILLFFKFLLITVLAGLILFPDEAIQMPLSDKAFTGYQEGVIPYQLFGVIIQINPNSIGMIAAILLYICIVRIMSSDRKSRLKKIIEIMLLLTILVFAQSRTAWIAFLLSGVFAMVIFASRKKKIIALIVIFSVGTVTYLNKATLYQYMTRGMSETRVMQMSGRINMWDVAIKRFDATDLENKIFGLGYMYANRMILATELGAEDRATLHSDYIDALISNGWSGLAALILSILYALRNILVGLIRPLQANPRFLELGGILIILVVRSITGTTFASHNHFLVLFLIIIVYVEFELQRTSRSSRIHLSR